ncbi:MAG: hypothetical protein ACKOB4_02135 [Acidobacteriota bacterium]
MEDLRRNDIVRAASRPLILILGLIILTGGAREVSAQRADPRDPQNSSRGRELLKKTIAARGGQLYTAIRSITATGLFTPFEKGLSQIPTSFENFIIYPDRERVEFGKGKKKDRRLQVNVGRGGWVYDGDAQTLKDQNDQQLADYLEGTEIDLDRLLRGNLDAPERKIVYAGREELRPGERAEMVTIELDQERQVSILLDRTSYLPISLVYEKSRSGSVTRQEIRFFQYVQYDGILFPNIIDFYRDGVQESRVTYQSIRINREIDERLFAKPASIKEVK